MDALVMCGGRGTRLEADVEKPLYELGGRTMIDRVIDALEGSRIETIHAAVSPQAPETRSYLDCDVIETPGEGYVADLDSALGEVGTPVLTLAADLPLLAPDAVDTVLDAHGARTSEASSAASTAVYVPAELKRALDVSVDTSFEHEGREIAPAGINVVGESDDEPFLTYDARLVVNVNRRSDAEVAEGLL